MLEELSVSLMNQWYVAHELQKFHISGRTTSLVQKEWNIDQYEYYVERHASLLRMPSEIVKTWMVSQKDCKATMIVLHYRVCEYW